MCEFFQETAVAKDDVKHASHDGAHTEKDKQPKVKQPGWQNMEANQGDERIQEAIYPSHDVRQMKAVPNKSRINKEFRFVSEEVKFFKIFYLSFNNFYSIDTCTANVFSP